MNASALLIAALLSAFSLVAGAVNPLDDGGGSSTSSDSAVAGSPTPHGYDVFGGSPTGAGAK